MTQRIITFFADDLDEWCKEHPFVVVGGVLGFCVISDIILRWI